MFPCDPLDTPYRGGDSVLTGGLRAVLSSILMFWGVFWGMGCTIYITPETRSYYIGTNYIRQVFFLVDIYFYYLYDKGMMVQDVRLARCIA